MTTSKTRAVNRTVKVGFSVLPYLSKAVKIDTLTSQQPMTSHLWKSTTIEIKLYPLGGYIPGVKPPTPVVQDTPCERLGNLAIHGEGCITHIPTSLQLARVGDITRAKKIVEAVAHLEWGNILQQSSILALTNITNKET